MRFSERRVPVDPFEVRVVEFGEGTPIVYLHGGGGLHIDRSLELLAESFRIVAFEMPGFGGSPANTRTATLAELAETMAGAVSAAGVGEGYVLFGTSFGGATALHMALRDPAPISALVLMSPGAFRPAGWAMPGPDDLPRLLHAHPERARPREPASPEVIQKQG